MTEIYVMLLFLLLVAGMSTGHHIAFVIGGVSIIVGLLGFGPTAMKIVALSLYSAGDDFTVAAIPMFILMANVLSRSMIADGLFESIRYLFGSFKGGLGVTAILLALLFSTTGFFAAGLIIVATLALPVLLRVGYKPELATGIVNSSGCLGGLLPPSIVIFALSEITDVSYGKMLFAVIIPGLILASCYVVYTLVVCRIRPEWGPSMSQEELAEMSRKQIITGVLINVVPPIILIFGVLGSIFFGFATPTESAAIGAAVSILLTMFYKKFSWKMLCVALRETMKTTAMIFILLVSASAFTSIFVGIGGLKMVINIVTTLKISGWVVFSLMCILVFVLGLFIDYLGVIMIVLPIFMPLLDLFGIDRMWAVVVVAVLMQAGFFTPPFGIAVFYTKGVLPELNTGMMFRGVVPFIIIIIFVTILCIIFPQIVTVLPNMMN